MNPGDRVTIDAKEPPLHQEASTTSPGATKSGAAGPSHVPFPDVTRPATKGRNP